MHQALLVLGISTTSHLNQLCHSGQSAYHRFAGQETIRPGHQQTLIWASTCSINRYIGIIIHIYNIYILYTNRAHLYLATLAGLFCLVDSECLMPQSTDSSLFTKILNSFKSSKVQPPRLFHGVRWKVGGNWDQVTIGTKQQVLRDCS